MEGLGNSVPFSEKQRLRVLVCATMWWPLSARLAIALIRHGCEVTGVCPAGHPMRFVQGIERIFRYKSMKSLGSLRSAITDSKPDLIIPCDDGVVWQLHALYATDTSLRPLIEKSLGSSKCYPIIQSRHAMLEAASEMNIRIPLTQTINREEDLSRWKMDNSSVLKLDGTWGGTGVSIVTSPDEAVSAYRRMSQPVRAGFAFKRWIVNSDPLALWLWQRRQTPSITIQEFVKGRPANTMMVCWNGEVLGIVTVEVLTSQGATGAATVIRVIRNEEIERAARLLAQRLGLSGFHGLDFMIEENTGATFLIELNPRCTQLGHLRLPGVGDLAGILIAKLAGTAREIPSDCIAGDTVAFFPQTLNWNPKSPYIRSAYHDVPWEEPALLRELLKADWPERRWVSRLYHHFRNRRQPEEVRF